MLTYLTVNIYNFITQIINKKWSMRHSTLFPHSEKYSVYLDSQYNTIQTGPFQCVQGLHVIGSYRWGQHVPSPYTYTQTQC